jgi:hypothetical protein
MPITVDGPARIPFPYGLFSVIDWSDDPHFSQGVQWETLSGDAVSGIANWFESCGEDVFGVPKGFVNLNDLATASAFTIYGSYVCAPLGYSLEHAEDMARQNLVVRGQSRVERALWTGDLENEPNFSDAVSNGSSKDRGPALADVEQYIVDHYGSLGVIHVPRSDALRFLADRLMKEENGRLYTKIGTPVVAGAGYPLTSPLTGASGHYLVGTGAIFGQRSDVFMPSARRGDLLDRGTNDLYGIAEQNYLIGYDMDPPIAAQFNIS